MMTREDVKNLLAMIQATYSNFNPMDKTAAVNAWHMALEDFDRNQLAMAFKAYVRTDTSGFAPTPGKLICMDLNRNLRNCLRWFRKQ